MSIPRAPAWPRIADGWGVALEGQPVAGKQSNGQNQEHRGRRGVRFVITQARADHPLFSGQVFVAPFITLTLRDLVIRGAS